MMEAGNLLLDEYPLILIRGLAHIGLSACEAAILQQVHYWTKLNKKAGRNFKEDYFWTFNTYEAWAEELAFWKFDKIKRSIASLEKKGLLVSANYNRLVIDRTKWYRVDYDALKSMKLVSGNAQGNLPRPTGQNPPIVNKTDFQGNLPLKGSPEAIADMAFRVRMANALEMADEDQKKYEHG